MQDHYAVLEISRNASQEEIREAYEARLSEYDPSRQLGRKLRELAEEETQRIQEAYAALSDPEQRLAYHARFSQHELNDAIERGSADILRYIQDQATIYNERAIEFFQQKRLADAITEWQKAIEITPEVAELHHNLGNAYAKHGQLREAIAAWERAISLAPNLAEAYNNVGYAYYKLRDYREARTRWEQALQVKPNCTQAKRNLRLLERHGAAAEPIQPFPEEEETLNIDWELSANPLPDEPDPSHWWKRIRGKLHRRRDS